MVVVEDGTSSTGVLSCLNNHVSNSNASAIRTVSEAIILRILRALIFLSPYDEGIIKGKKKMVKEE
jgi:hypothetical protein